jgi:hypothetical protein
MFAIPANGMKGMMLRMWNGQYVFRVTSKDGNFVDCDLSHNDFSIEIQDPDAYFYMLDDGSIELDHSPETLGMSDVTIVESIWSKK